MKYLTHWVVEKRLDAPDGHGVVVSCYCSEEEANADRDSRMASREFPYDNGPAEVVYIVEPIVK